MAIEAPPFSYSKFVKFAVDEARLRTNLTPHPSQEKFECLKAKDGKTMIRGLSFEAPKIRLLRSMSIDGGNAMQVLDLAAFPDPKYDLPIFCANFFSTASLSIVVLDLNPLFDVIIHRDYKEKYYKKLIPLGCKYTEVLPWGEKLTSESLRFFSPIVIWTKFTPSRHKHDVLYSAFVDYFKAWVDMMDIAEEETDSSKILHNREAQHRYLTWRVEKDPGYPVLRKLLGDCLATEMVRHFLFDGVDSLGTMTFLDYFPEYYCDDGTVNKKRSIIGKSYQTRPWDSRGEFMSGESV